MEQRANSPRGELYCPTCETTFSTGERCPNDDTRLVRLTKAPDALVGRELDGRYTILERLGAGGMGAVYRGTQHSVGRDIAIKVVTPSLISEEVAIKRFLREAKLASRLSHPNAVSVLDFGQTDDGLFYLVMELVAGRTLDKVIDAEGPMPPARLVRLGTQICDALEGAHAIEIVHRDLKPQNVMIMSSGRDFVKVLDFGLAKSLQSGPGAGVTTMTNAGAILGTPAFMPPELASGEECDGRADLYSLGCVLHYAATGEQPFKAATVHELIAMHASEPAPKLPELGALGKVIGRLLEKEPARRFQTAVEAREALELALATPLVVDPPDLNDLANNLDADTELQPSAPTMLGMWSTAPMRPSSPTIAGAGPAPIRPVLPGMPPAPTTPARGVSIRAQTHGGPQTVRGAMIAPITPSAGVRMHPSAHRTTPGHGAPSQSQHASSPRAVGPSTKAMWLIAIAAVLLGSSIAFLAMRGSDEPAPPAADPSSGSQRGESATEDASTAAPPAPDVAPVAPAPTAITPPENIPSPPLPAKQSASGAAPAKPAVPGALGPQRPAPKQKRRVLHTVPRSD